MLLRKTIVFVVLLILKESTQVSSKKQCSGGGANVIFVMDSSSSIWSVDYSKQLVFVQNLIDNFHIGTHDKAIHVGAITFSDDAHLEFSIDQYNTSEDIKAAVGRIPYRSGVTNTAKALRLVKHEIELKGNIYRAPFIVVVITDGQSRNPEATRRAANILHELGVYIYAIGVGNSYDLKELQDIASDGDNYVHEVGDYTELEGMGELFEEITCTDITPNPPIKRPTTTTAATTTATTTTETTTEPTTGPKTQMPTSTMEPKPDNMFGDQPPKQETHTISFGFDLISLGIRQAYMILQYISYILPLNYYGNYSIISQYSCGETKTGLEGFNIILMPITNTTAITSVKEHLPGMASIVKRLSFNLYMRNLNNAQRGVMGHEVTVLFVDSSLTKLTPELIKHIKDLKLAGSKVYIIDVGKGNWRDLRLLESLSSQPPKRYIFKVPTYIDLLDKKRRSSDKFLADCAC